MATLTLTSASAAASSPLNISTRHHHISTATSTNSAAVFFHSSHSTSSTTRTIVAPLLFTSRWIATCQLALRSELESEAAAAEADEEAVSKVGSRVKVKVPLKVFHVPKVAEVDLTGREGVIKQYVGVWKGKRISANFPYKVEFQADLPERGVVKFAAHLREDEFEFLG